MRYAACDAGRPKFYPNKKSLASRLYVFLWKKRFWKTIPGILAGVATVITTLYGVKVALQGLGVIQPKVGVPYVVNMTEDEALRKITEKGFTFGGATEKKTRIQEEDGKVVDQEPDGGTSMAKGQPIRIILAKQMKVTVPLVEGKPLAAATAVLEAAGLKGRDTWNYPLKGGQNKDASEFYGVGKLTVRFNSNTPLPVE